jgi:hypothetical protein
MMKLDDAIGAAGSRGGGGARPQLPNAAEWAAAQQMLYTHSELIAEQCCELGTGNARHSTARGAV